MDSMIQALGLLILDVHEPTVSIFSVDEIPVTSTNVLNLTLQPGGTLFSGAGQTQSPKYTSTHPETPSEVDHPPFSKTPAITWNQDEEFEDSLLRPLPSLQSLDGLKVRNKLRKTWLGLLPDEFDRAQDQTAQGNGDGDEDMLLKQPPWPDSENKAEVQKEELRRLCWSALTITTNLTKFTPYLEQCVWNLQIMKQENVCS